MTIGALAAAALGALGVGLALGALGGGGSILVLPLLVGVLGQSAHEAAAISLIVVGATSALGVITHARHGRVRWRTGLAFAGASSLAAFAAGRVAHLVPGGWLVVGFAAVMIAAAGAMLGGTREPRGAERSDRPLGPIVVAGLGTGALTGLVGAGGGFLIVPALAVLLGLAMREAVGTSLLVIALTSLAGLVGRAGTVPIDLGLAAAMTGAALAGSIAGAAIGRRVEPVVLRRAFGVLVMAVAAALIAREVSIVTAVLAIVAALALVWARSRRSSGKGGTMIVRQLFDPDTSTYTYLVADPVTRQALLIDPVIERVDRDLELVRDLGLELVHAVDTHVHADHVTGLDEIRRRTGARTALSWRAGVSCADRALRDGDRIPLGRRWLEVRETPGHTDGCLTYVLDDRSVAFTGDALLIRGTGRTDFQQGDARTLYRSIHEKIFTLPDEAVLYPGHDYRGRTTTTVGEEKRLNARVGAHRTADEFVELMSRLELGAPKRMAEALPRNRACGREDAGAPGA